MVTVVLAATGDVAIVNNPTKLFSAAVTVAGTLATPGLLLDRLITAPPNGAPVLNTTVPLEELPPTIVVGLMSIEPRPGGGGDVPGLTRPDRGPRSRHAIEVDAADAPEMRRGREAAGRINQQRRDVLLLAHQRRGEGARIVDLNRVRRRAGGDGPLEIDRLRFVGAVRGREQRRRGRNRRRRRRRRHRSELADEGVAPEHQHVAVPDRVERAGGRRVVERVGVPGDVDAAARYRPRCRCRPRCPCRRGRSSRASVEPVLFSSEMKTSDMPLCVLSAAPTMIGKSVEPVTPVTHALPAPSSATALAPPPRFRRGTSSRPAPTRPG